MKNNIIMNLVLLPLAAMLSACTAEIAEKEPVTVGEDIVTANGSGVKTMLDGTKVLWSSGDEMSVLSSTGNGEFILAEGAGTAKGTFKGTLPGSGPYYALYPYDASSVIEGSALKFPVARKQTYAYNSFGSGSNPVYGKLGEDHSTDLKNLFGSLCLAFTGNFSVSRIVLKDIAGAGLWGTASLTLDDKAGGDGQTLTLSGGSDTVELECGNGVDVESTDTPTYFYISLPAGSLSQGFTVTLYDGDAEIGTLTSAKPHTIARNTISMMPPVLFRKDLGIAETANSYMVNGAGSYKFKAVKGNSSEALVGVVSASIVWETVNTKTAPSVGSIVKNVSYEGGYVLFDATGTAGNALIAVKDASGDILWSWHIWVPKTKVRTLVYSSLNPGGVMDRNLGALDADDRTGLENGMLYQWGRKDPFPGNANHSAGVVMKATANINKETTSETVGTVDYATKHPTTFIVGPKIDNVAQDWVYGRNNTNWSNTKTVYDPCPPGYRVASQTIWNDNTILAGFKYNSGDLGVSLNEGSMSTWYPFDGCIWNDGSYHASGNTISIWACEAVASSTSHAANRLFAELKNGAAIPKMSTVVRSYGCPVRCMTDKTPAPVRPGIDQHDFFKALPSDVKVSAVEAVADGYKLEFTDGSSFDLPRDSYGYVTVSEDGYWVVNGRKQQYRFASKDFYTIGSDGKWQKNGEATGIRATPKNHSMQEQDIYVTNVIESARRVKVNFSDATSLSFEKKIDWELYVKKTEKELTFYMGHACSNDWIQYRFYYRNKNVDNPDTYPNHLDNWGLGQPRFCTRNGTTFTQGKDLFLTGEAEAAVQVPDKRDATVYTYTGGTLHGWENILTDTDGSRQFTIKVDGVPVGEKASLSLTKATKIEIEQHTRIARAYGDPVDDQYATIVKRWLFTDGTVQVYDEYTFTKSIEIKQAKFGMFCVIRDFGDGSYLTNLAVKDTNPHKAYLVENNWEKDCKESHDALSSRDIAVKRMEEYGENGISFALQYDGGTLKSKGGFNIGTNGNNYNKIYFDICGGYTPSAGETLYSTVHWELDYISDYSKF